MDVLVPQMMAQASDAKGDLFALCQRYKWRRPKFIMNTVRQSRRTMILVVASVVACGAKYESMPCKAPSKREADAMAAADLSQKLTELVADGKIQAGEPGVHRLEPSFSASRTLSTCA